MAAPTTDAPSVAHRPGHALPGYVRKSETSEILVRDWRADSEESQVVTLRWPRAHAFYTLHENVTSPLLFTESIRQALALLSHTVHHIPLDHRLGWEYARATVAPSAVRQATAPAMLTMRITHTSVTRRRLGSVQVTAEIDAKSDGGYVGSAEIRYVTHPPTIYRRLRGRYADATMAFGQALPPAPALTADQVGRARPQDVVLSPTATAHRWRLRVDTAHPVLFDHSHDHVPGMLLLEAAAQAAQIEAMPHPVLALSYESTFFHYVELDQPCWVISQPCAADPLGRGRVKVDGIQGDRVVSSTVVVTIPTS